jgi:hypothetical protein
MIGSRSSRVSMMMVEIGLYHRSGTRDDCIQEHRLPHEHEGMHDSDVDRHRSFSAQDPDRIATIVFPEANRRARDVFHWGGNGIIQFGRKLLEPWSLPSPSS